MATVHVVLVKALTSPDNAPVPNDIPIGVDTLTSDTSFVTSSLVAGNSSQDVWDITVIGGAVWVRFDGDAATETGWLLLDGSNRQFLASAGGAVSVIDA